MIKNVHMKIKKDLYDEFKENIGEFNTFTGAICQLMKEEIAYKNRKRKEIGQDDEDIYNAIKRKLAGEQRSDA